MRRTEVDEWFWQVGADLHLLSEEMSRGGPVLAARKCWQPRVDVVEEIDRLVIRAEIAGMRGEDIQLAYLPERHSVMIRGSRQDADGEDGRRVRIYQLEIYHGEFEREVGLPSIEIDATDIRAHYRNGFLTISLPKQERESGPRS